MGAPAPCAVAAAFPWRPLAERLPPFHRLLLPNKMLGVTLAGERCSIIDITIFKR